MMRNRKMGEAERLLPFLLCDVIFNLDIERTKLRFL